MTVSFRFRPPEVILLSLYPLALVLKYLHIPVANVLLMFSFPLPIVYYMVHGIVQLSKNPGLLKENKAFLPSSFLGGSLTIWMLYITWQLMSLPAVITLLFFCFACVVSVVCLVVVFRHKAVEAVPLIAFLLFVGGSVLLRSTPFYKVYYFMNLQATVQAGKDPGPDRWDRYSWLLFHAGEVGAALDANTKARKAAGQENHSDTTDPVSRELENHREYILSHSWDRFRSLEDVRDSVSMAH